MYVARVICNFFCQRCSDSYRRGRQPLEDLRDPLTPQGTPSAEMSGSTSSASLTPDSAFGGGQTQQGTASKGSPPRRLYGDGFPIDRGRNGASASGFSHRNPSHRASRCLPPDLKA